MAHNFWFMYHEIHVISFRYYLGFILRFLTGVFHAPTFPTLQGMWTQWAPKQEKSRLVCAHFMGVPSGSVLISLIGGKLGGAFGWKSLFYFSGVANFVCGICWYILVRQNPKSHPFISDDERDYILENRLSQKKPKKASDEIRFRNLDPHQLKPKQYRTSPRLEEF